ncbi:hypothetical protein Pmani_040072 [Petrolisthes manimaculis]|uniref:Uncharacterized protein n=1 Tax=Petrolisthes manimaculis TaxID=1843537 RepID=A0AAE1NCU5_9EUCA|nr:hypothetical protein Pmani_040072 [Petrolisthes manimaculis]
MRKLPLRCSPTPHTVPLAPTPPPTAGLSPTPTPPTTPARRLVASRSLGSTSSPPLTPPVSQYNIPPCLPSHQHHAQLPPTPGPPSHRSLPALHAHHVQEGQTHHSSHPTLHAHHPPPDAHPHHSSHPALPSQSPHSSPPTTRPPGHFSHAPLLTGHHHPRQLPGLPRHHTIGGVGSGRILPPAPPHDPIVSSTAPGSPAQTMLGCSSLAARPAHVLHSATYKYSLDVPRVNLRDVRSNTYPPPGTDGSSPSQSSSTTSGATSGRCSSGSQNSPSDIFPPPSPRLSPGGAVLVGGRVSPLPGTPPALIPPHSPGPRSSLSSSLSSSCATSPVPRHSPVPRSPVHSIPLTHSGHSSPSPAPGHVHVSPIARHSPIPGTRGSPTLRLGSPGHRKNTFIEPPASPLLRRTTRPPLQRSHAVG